MSECLENEESLQNNILNEMISQLQKNPAFDNETIEKLRILISRGELRKAAKVMEAIKPKGGD